MKILIGAALYYPHVRGGGEISTRLLAEQLIDLGHEVYILTTSNVEEEEEINEVKIYRVKTNIYWGYENERKSKLIKLAWHLIDSCNFFMRSKFESILRQIAPEILHTSTIEGLSPYLWKVARSLKIPVVHTLRSYTLICPKATMFRKGYNCLEQCAGCRLVSSSKLKLSKCVDHVVGVSSYVLNMHLKNGFFPNVGNSVIFNPIKYAHLSHGLNRDSVPYIFGYVGRLEEEKGVELLLDSYIEANLEGAILNVYGRGEVEYVERLIAKYTYRGVRFLGYKPESEIYKEIDMLVVPSLWQEPFGRIVPEANSYGIPVIVSQKGGLPELIKPGVNGFTYSGKEELVKLLGDASSMRFDSNLIHTMAKKYMVDVHAKKYESIYFSLVKRDA